jgi:LacI family transcriptional regulator
VTLARSPQAIGLAFPRGGRHELLVEGISEYAQKNGRAWTYVNTLESPSLSLANLVDWQGAGVIAALNTARDAEFAANFHLPIVNISGILKDSPVPRSRVDERAIGAAAAEHLHERGFHHYAFYGLRNVEYSRLRQEAFNSTLATIGFGAAALTLDSTLNFDCSTWLTQQRALSHWLATLDTPCGVFVASDSRARQLIDACIHLNLKVPDQIAVVAVDELPYVNEHIHPTITSISRDFRREGYHAAALLDSLMRGKRAPSEVDAGVPRIAVARESTSTFAVGDKRLRDAMVFVRNCIGQPFVIRDVCDHVKVSRRWLEYSFRGTLGETPYQYVQRQRVEHAQRLIANNPETKLFLIAQQVGFSSAKQLAKVFRRELGMSPRHFRQSVASK